MQPVGGGVLSAKSLEARLHLDASDDRALTPPWNSPSYFTIVLLLRPWFSAASVSDSALDTGALHRVEEREPQTHTLSLALPWESHCASRDGGT